VREKTGTEIGRDFAVPGGGEESTLLFAREGGGRRWSSECGGKKILRRDSLYRGGGKTSLELTCRTPVREW